MFSQSIKVYLGPAVLVGQRRNARNGIVVVAAPEVFVLHHGAVVDLGIEMLGEVAIKNPAVTRRDNETASNAVILAQHNRLNTKDAKWSMAASNSTSKVGGRRKTQNKGVCDSRCIVTALWSEAHKSKVFQLWHTPWSSTNSSAINGNIYGARVLSTW